MFCTNQHLHREERFWPRLCCGPNEKEPILEELPPIPEHCLPEDVDRIIGRGCFLGGPVVLSVVGVG